MGLTYPLVFLFSTYPEWRGIGLALFALTAVVIAALGVLGRKWFNAHPLLFVSLSFLDAAALFTIVFKYADRTIFWFVVWLSSVCLFTLYISLKIRNPGELRKTEWERIFLMIVPVVFFTYATKVYPKIRHQFGGGAPVPVVLHLAKKMPVFDSTSVPVSLIDETEQGYYVVRGSHKALFVARALVEEVEFLREQPSQNTGAKP